MAITYPRPFPAVKVGTSAFRLQRNDISTPDGAGVRDSVQIGFGVWTASYVLEAMSDADSVANEAFIDSLHGSANLWLAHDLRRLYPAAYLPRRNFAGGLPAGFSGSASAWSVDTARTGVSLDGLPVGFTLGVGDYVGFKWGSGENRRHMVKVMEAATADGSGEVALNVYPAVWETVPVDAVAHFDRPACIMKLTPDTEMSEFSPDGQAQQRIVGVQVVLP